MKKYAYVQFGNHNGGVNSKEYAYNCGATLSRVLQEGDIVLVDARGELEIAVVHRLSTECEYEGATKEVLALVESNQDYISKIDFKEYTHQEIDGDMLNTALISLQHLMDLAPQW